jgi:predicted SprT family Zn-dependent metalloprotease
MYPLSSPTERKERVMADDGVVSYDTETPIAVIEDEAFDAGFEEAFTLLHSTVTQVEYQAFQTAYTFFNETLFDDCLPEVLITLQRKGRSHGYFAAERFRTRRGALGAVHELALNPARFTERDDQTILSTLVHEMCHVWQQTHGTPPRPGYHDREWAAKMQSVGLQPSSTGEPGGKATGQRMSHYIIADGAYAAAYARLQASGFVLHWQSQDPDPQAQTKKASKTKYTCPACHEQNAWAKPTARLVCGDCMVPMEPTP